jgi:excisionase family DNA binding protein
VVTVTTLDDLADRLFADVPEVASITGRDPRTIRAAAESGQIPATKVGKKYLIPTAWLRDQMSQSSVAGAAPGPNLDDLADQVADRLFARFTRAFGAMLTGGSGEAA